MNEDETRYKTEDFEEYCFSNNIYDLGRWKNINNKLRDFLIEKGPIRDNDLIFSKAEFSRHFSITYHIKKIPNGEKYNRRWLVYSKDFDKVYCFCHKLFNTNSNKSQLSNGGTNDWKNLSVKLKSHEISNEHITNMNLCVELEVRLLKKRTIDKDIQEKIDKERDHWEKVLIIIIVVVNSLAKNNLAFRGKNEKIYQDNNGKFSSLIEMIA